MDTEQAFAGIDEVSENLQENCAERECFFFKKVGNIFSMCCNYTFLAYKLFITFAIYLKKIETKKNRWFTFGLMFFALYTGHRTPFWI